MRKRLGGKPDELRGQHHRPGLLVTQRWIAHTLRISLTALAFVGCGGGDKDPSSVAPVDQPGIESPADEPAAPPGQVDVEDSTIPEEQLASIEEGSSIVEEVAVTRYGVLLDRLQENCADRRSTLADYIVNTQRLLKDEQGVEVGVREIAEKVADASADHDASLKCDEVFVLYGAVAGE